MSAIEILKVDPTDVGGNAGRVAGAARAVARRLNIEDENPWVLDRRGAEY
jgi:hypothetical protein